MSDTNPGGLPFIGPQYVSVPMVYGASVDMASISRSMTENQDKPRNSTNNVSFAELMRMLKGEG